MEPNYESLRIEICRIMRLMAEQGLIRSSDGNVSVRLNENCFLMSPAGVYKMTMTPDQIVMIDAAGGVIDGKPGLKASSEWRLHLAAYRQRKDIGAVVHAHPPYATALSVITDRFPIDIIPEVIVTLGEIPVAAYGTPGTEDLARSIIGHIDRTDAVVLSHHGSLTVGKTLEEALIALERMEHTARVYYLAKTMGEVKPLAFEETERLLEIHKKLFGKC